MTTIDEAVKLHRKGLPAVRLLDFLEKHNFEVFRKTELHEVFKEFNPHTLNVAIAQLFDKGRIGRRKVGLWNYYGSKVAVNQLVDRLMRAEEIPETRGRA